MGSIANGTKELQPGTELQLARARRYLAIEMGYRDGL
jgi:hypothetical protein